MFSENFTGKKLITWMVPKKSLNRYVWTTVVTWASFVFFFTMLAECWCQRSLILMFEGKHRYECFQGAPISTLNPKWEWKKKEKRNTHTRKRWLEGFYLMQRSNAAFLLHSPSKGFFPIELFCFFLLSRSNFFWNYIRLPFH